MEKLICTSCGATLNVTTISQVLVCEYCDTAVANPYYDESAALAAATPTLPELCVQTLLEMGANENLADVDNNCFGQPITNIDSARAAMGIPDKEKVYFLYDRQSLLGLVLGVLAEGLALTDSGLYYKCNGESGSRSWEAFITGAISCTLPSDWQQEGRLSIGSSLGVAVTSDAESRLARFLIDFHNRVYHKHTGQTAPESWCVNQRAVQVQSAASGLGGALGKATLAGTVLTAAQSLLQRSVAQRTAPQRHVVQRPTVMRTVKRPEPQRHQPRREMPQRPAQPMHRQQTQHPGGMFRPSAPAGRPGRHGGMVGGRGMGGPGRGRR